MPIRCTRWRIVVRASHPGHFNHRERTSPTIWVTFWVNSVVSLDISEKRKITQGLSRGDLVTLPTELTSTNITDGIQGWPALQIQLLQELVVAARRMGHSALATRHMTFLLQTMWDHLLPAEQRDLALQLQVLAAQCEGAPVPLVLNSGFVIPPANLTNLPQIR